MITQEFVKNRFEYRDGDFYNMFKTNKFKFGHQAGTLARDGYIKIYIHGKIYSLHRLIFLYHHGFLPSFIDHVDRNKLNNKIENLRGCTMRENNCNKKSKKNSSSKYLGVSWCNTNKKWIACIAYNGVNITIGRFLIESNAALAYNRAAVMYHKEFANLNIINL